MNYYNPSYYMNAYPYNNQYPLPVQQQQSTYNMPQPMTTQMQQQSSLNGKIVDSEDVVKATEVPIGGYGIFPKADLSEIYIKSWNNNGTTSVITFKPVIPDPSSEPVNNNEISNILLQKIELLENKLDMILSQPVAAVPANDATYQQLPQKKQEVIKNGF